MHVKPTPNRRRATALAVATAALIALGASGVARATTEPATTEPAASEPAASEPVGSGAPVAVDLDANGDGVVKFGVAIPGPRDDGAYYQATVDGVNNIAEANGFAEPIIVDNIPAADAETELRNLARQDVDVIVVGAGELSDPLPALTEEFSDILWYCNCGAGAPENPNLVQVRDDSAQISYTAGYATGQLLSDTDSTSVAFLGCCDLDFEKEAFLAFELGLQAVNPDFTVTYIPTGDFNDVAGATEAYNQALATGIGAVYPYLGGSHEAIVGLANEDGIITMSAGRSDACEREDLHYDIAVQFDSNDYMLAVFEAILAGTLTEGEIMYFNVGEFEKVGAKLCAGTPEQEAALQAVRDQIAAGDFVDQFNEIKAEAYGFPTTSAPSSTSPS